MRMPGPALISQDGAASLAEALGNVRGQKIDTANIETDRLYRAFSHQPVVGVDDVGHIDCRAACREVCRFAEKNFLAFRRHRVVAVALRVEHTVRSCIEFKSRQHVFMTNAAQRVPVFDLDQFFNRVLAIADNVTRHAFRGGDELSIDHQQSVIKTGDHAFDNNAAAFVIGNAKSCFDITVRSQINRNAAPVITIDRLNDHGIANPVCGGGQLRLHYAHSAVPAPADRDRIRVACRIPCPMQSQPRCEAFGW